MRTVARWGNTAPLGRPVVPEVYMIDAVLGPTAEVRTAAVELVMIASNTSGPVGGAP